ncbi:galectin 17 [Salminus brasiliensis]|uniref:galectin 17 n=1 Tax=Salminus brasiliensis TaxID=930266 RepID=UPI003B834CF4
MDTRRSSCRVCAFTITWLWLLAYVDTSPFSSTIHTWSGVGLQAILPCTWTTHVENLEPQLPYIQWETTTHTVFERKGEKMFQGESFQDRVDVPKEILEVGNCSLFFTDVQFSDAGFYSSYLVVGQSMIKKRILLQSVQLLVFDHKLVQSVESGEDLVLDLYTSHAKTLVFESIHAPGWTVLWQRGKNKDRASRLEENERSLVLRRVRSSDSGTYRVADSDGLALSTVKVSVTDPVSAKSSEELGKQISLGSGSVNSPALHIMVATLLSTLMMHLL